MRDEKIRRLFAGRTLATHAVVCPYPAAPCVCGFRPPRGGLEGVAPRHEAPRRSPAHDKLEQACPICGAPPREQCVGRDGHALPATYVHARRLFPPLEVKA